MTAAAAGAPPRSEPRPRTSAIDALAFVASVLMILIYSGAWVAPLFGEVIDPDSSGAIRAFFMPAYAVGALLLLPRPTVALQGALRQPFLFAILVVAAGSFAWSVSPDETLRRVAALLLTTLSGVALGARWRWSALADILAVAFVAIAVGSLLAALFLPDVGRMTDLFPGAWRGLYTEKNAFGERMVVALLAFVGAALLNPVRARLWWSMAALAIALILLSTSKTSLVAIAPALAAVGLILFIRRGGSYAVLGVAFGIVGLLGLGGAVVLAPDLFLGLLGKDATLTGRTQIWSAVMTQIQQRPLTGFGYGAVWTEDGSWGPLAWIIKDAGFKPESAHNSWLDQWLNTGVAGLGAWSLYFATTTWSAVRSIFTTRGALLAAPFLIAYTVITFTESIAVIYNELTWVAFVAIATRLAIPETE